MENEMNGVPAENTEEVVKKVEGEVTDSQVETPVDSEAEVASIEEAIEE